MWFGRRIFSIAFHSDNFLFFWFSERDIQAMLISRCCQNQKCAGMCVLSAEAHVVDWSNWSFLCLNSKVQDPKIWYHMN